VAGDTSFTTQKRRQNDNYIRVLLALSRVLGMIQRGQYQQIELKFVVR